jgi:hypothetical protein|tara:strand:+ start:2213 stop:2467 length:255 start_codon:yes stop_codon:yes gene_type:complete
MNKVFNSEEVAKLTQVINDGMKVKQELKDLSEGLRDTVKAVAEEMEIKPAVLTKAVNIAFKESLSAEREDFEYLETILEAAKKA